MYFLYSYTKNLQYVSVKWIVLISRDVFMYLLKVLKKPLYERLVDVDKV